MSAKQKSGPERKPKKGALKTAPGKGRRRHTATAAVNRRLTGKPPGEISTPKPSNQRTAERSAEQMRARMAQLQTEMDAIDLKFAVHNSAHASIPKLINLAQEGCELSTRLLLAIAVRSVAALNWMAYQQPDLIRSLASQTFAWPALIGSKRFFATDNIRLLKQIDLLGGGGPFSQRRWQPGALATRAALWLLTPWLADNAPPQPLTPTAKKELFEQLWRELLATGVELEKTFLWELGRSAINKKSESRGMSAQTPGMLRCDVEWKIKELVFKSFCTVLA